MVLLKDQSDSNMNAGLDQGDKIWGKQLAITIL